MSNESDFPIMPERKTTAPLTAADWVVRLHSDQVVQNDQVEFQAWLAANSENDREFRAYEELWLAVGELANNRDARELLARPVKSNRKGWKRLLWGALAVSAVAASIALIVGPGLVAYDQYYETARGERRSVVLPDGSSITLNTDSALRVILRKDQRRVVLERGEFFVDVAKDSKRPFRVFVDNHEVRAVGTAFDVYRDDVDKKVEVTLERGIVAVYEKAPELHGLNALGFAKPDLSTEPSVLLKPGERATLASSAPVNVSVLNVQAAKSWRDGEIVFDETPLREAVKEVNRYRVKQIVVRGVGLGDLRISGSFHITSLDSFVETLTAAFPVRIEREDSATVVITSG